MDYLSCLLMTSNPEAGLEIKSLFEEYEAAITPEAKFVREIDAFECLVQAEEYEEREKRSPEEHRLHEFIRLESRITSPELSKWTKLLAQERSEIASKRSSEIIIVFVIGECWTGHSDAAHADRMQEDQVLVRVLNALGLLQTSA